MSNNFLDLTASNIIRKKGNFISNIQIWNYGFIWGEFLLLLIIIIIGIYKNARCKEGPCCPTKITWCKLSWKRRLYCYCRTHGWLFPILLNLKFINSLSINDNFGFKKKFKTWFQINRSLQSSFTEKTLEKPEGTIKTMGRTKNQSFFHGQLSVNPFL
jgi:hypothetical protein